MKIAHIVCTYPPYYGGMGNVAFQMVQGLLDRNHDVTTYTPLYDTVASEVPLLHVTHLTPKIAFGNAALVPELYKRLDTYDLVHLHYPFYGVAFGVQRWKRSHREVPLVVTYHMDARADGLKGLGMKWYAKLLMPRILGQADAITVSSFDYAAASEAKGIFEKKKECWHEVPFGVDLDRFTPNCAFPHLKHDLQIPTHHKTILFVGGMDQAHYFKGITILLRALTKLDDVTLILAGDGDLRGEYELEAAQRGVGERTHFLGYVSDDDLPRYYASVDAVVLPSIHSAEAFGMVLLEAMSCGTPVVASDLPGVRTVVAHGGVVTPPGDSDQLAVSIKSVLSEGMSREAIRKNIREKYSWANTIDQLETLYQSLVEKR